MKPSSFGEPLGTFSEVPLFPLDMVLFPQMLVPLHIFEERYKEMINRCVRESLPFGIVLVASETDEDARPLDGGTPTYRVGCTARIARVERLPDGRMNIEVVGENRFRLLDTHETEPYRVGLIEPIQDEPTTDRETLAHLADDVQTLLRDYLTRTLALMQRRDVEFELPTEAEPLSFTAACVLPVDNDDKQALLEQTDVALRLLAERDVLRREVARLRTLTTENGDETGGGDDADAPVERVWKPVRSAQFDDLLGGN